MDYDSFYLVSINFTIHPVKGVGNSRGECDGGEGDPREGGGEGRLVNPQQ